jgi:hypothetical protein
LSKWGRSFVQNSAAKVAKKLCSKFGRQSGEEVLFMMWPLPHFSKGGQGGEFARGRESFEIITKCNATKNQKRVSKSF